MHTVSDIRTAGYEAPEIQVLNLSLENGCLSNETQKDGGESSWDEL